MLTLLGGLVNRGEEGRQGFVGQAVVGLDVAAFGQHFEEAEKTGELAA
jgi:hypothetical protein